jgi:hypothetical protein
MLEATAPDPGPMGGNRMTRTRISTLGFALLIGFALATSVSAQVRMREKTDFAITGDITAINTAEKTLTLESTNDKGQVYTVNDTTTFMSGANKVTFGDLRRGMNVVANGRDDGETRLITYLKITKAP